MLFLLSCFTPSDDNLLCITLCFYSFLDKLYMGPGQLYHDLQYLLHDLSVVGQIGQLIGSLKGNYQVIKLDFIFCCSSMFPLHNCLPQDSVQDML